MIIETTETAARSPEATPSRPRIHRKGYMICCPGCRKTFITFLPREQREVCCRECGACISLDGLRKVYAVCDCGGYSALRTNILAPKVEISCPACRKTMTAAWDDLRKRYECGLQRPVRQPAAAEAAAPREQASDKELIRLPLMVLHDKFGFGRERAGRFIAHMTTLAEEYHSGEVTLQDITDALEADGIKIEEDR